MSWPETPVLTRVLAVIALAGLTAGCFQPMYGDSNVVASAGLNDRLAGVQVRQIVTPNGTPLARIGVGVRNELIYDLTGGGNPATPSHTLVVSLSSTQLQVIVDITTNRPEIQNYGIDATYSLIDNATGKTVMSGQTFSRVSYDIPGQQQRFAGARGLRDAENRASKVIADNIRSRLASYFVAGS
jgi:LPS-assembly lipoprotein